MKKITSFLMFGLLVVSAKSQITITNQPDSPVLPNYCEGANITLSTTATPVGLTYAWEVKYKTVLDWTTITSFGLPFLKSIPGFENVEILNYNTPNLLLKNVSNRMDSVQFRCKIIQLMPSNTATTTEPYISINALPSIDKTSSVFNGCEPSDINISIKSLYTPIAINSCQYTLQKGTTTLANINNTNPDITEQLHSKFDSSGVYTLTTTSKISSCVHIETLNIQIQTVYNKDSIGGVTFDPTTNKYKLLCNITPYKGTEGYGVYSMMGPIGQTKLISNVTYSSLYGTYLDTTKITSAPSYQITLKDSCGHVSPPSKIHKPMFLQTTVGTNSNELIFSWNKYEGLTYPKFFLHCSANKDSIYLKKNVIATISSDSITSYTLTSATPNRYYAISIDFPNSITLNPWMKSESGPYTQSLSNIAEYKVTELNTIKKLPVSIFPNPFSNNLQIDFTLDKSSEVIIEITNAIGQNVFETNLGVLQSGNQSKQIAAEQLNDGIYFIKITADNQTAVIKAVCKK